MSHAANGILLLDKPASITSNAALQKVKRLFSAKKAGHTGSLDPIATGMLPICFGEATKFSQFLLESDKSYYVVAKLGAETTTGDIEGEVISKADEFNCRAEDIQKTLQGFLGEQLQIPPMYSAIKYKGKPLYTLARKGIEIKREPRRIFIKDIELIDTKENTFSFNVHCSKGTYIRTLVTDIGRLLNCFAHVIELRRVAVSPYLNKQMYSLPALQTIFTQHGLSGLHSLLLPIETSVDVYPEVKLSTVAAFYLRMGQPVRTTVNTHANGMVRLLSEDSRFLGIGEMLADGRIKPHRLVAKVS